MHTSVVIASRKEPDLEATVADIHANSNATCVVMEDEHGHGPQQMRHRGIMGIQTDVIIIMDGHMRVRPDTIATLAEQANKGGVACGRCYHHYEPWGGDKPYCGARFVWQSKEPGNQHWALPAKWRHSDKLGKIGAVMGACYAFRRDWYIDGMNMPWQFGTGWGCDEEVLSISNYLAGGDNVLVPADVWHRARAQGDIPFQYTPRQWAGVWANRMRLIEMMPMSEDERAEQFAWLTKTPADWQQVAGICRLSAEKVQEWRENACKNGVRTWSEWRKRWCKMDKKEVISMADLRAQCRRRSINVPQHATKSQLCTLLHGKNAPKRTKTEEVPPKIEYVTLRVAKDNGIACVHCAHGYDHRTTHTYPNGNRRVLCGRCKKPFITCRVD